MCMSRLMAIQPSFAACDSGPPLGPMRIGVPSDVPRTSDGRTSVFSTRPPTTN